MMLDFAVAQHFHQDRHGARGIAFARLDHLDLPGSYTQEGSQARLRVAASRPDRFEGVGAHSDHLFDPCGKNGLRGQERCGKVDRADRYAALFFVVSSHPSELIVAFILPFREDFDLVAALDHCLNSVSVEHAMPNIVRVVNGYFARGAA